MERPRLDRRQLLTGAGLAAAAGLAGCGNGGSPASSGSPKTTPTGSSPTPTAPAAPAPAPAPASPTLDEAQLRRKIASLLVAGFRGQQVSASDWIMTAISQQGLGGVILFDRDQLTGAQRNIVSPEQVTALVKTLRAASPGKLIVSIDQEGGQASRLNPDNGFPATRSQQQIGAINNAATTTAWGQQLAGMLTQIGAGLNYTPVVDLNVNPSSPAIGELQRSFSADPNVVVANASLEVAAHRAAGVHTVLKHFPGIGSTTTNTDFGIADVSSTWTPTELEPYRQLIAGGYADSIMAGHVLNKQLDPSRPASLSPPMVHDVLRGQLGWQGPVVSDDMQAAAITQQYGAAQAAAMAIAAGLDLLVYANQQVYDPNVVTQTVDTIVGLVRSGQVTEAQIDQSVARVDTLRPAA
jgi:beta-N-acetylhexosaminidase